MILDDEGLPVLDHNSEDEFIARANRLRANVPLRTEADVQTFWSPSNMESSA